MFWFVSLFLALVVAAIVLSPLLRGAQTKSENPDVALYKAQLLEIDNDLARGLIPEEDAERTRTEIARRLLSVAKSSVTSSQADHTSSPKTTIAAGIGTIAFAIAGYVYLGQVGETDQPLAARLAQAEEMRVNRPSQAEFEEATGPYPPVDAPQDYLDSVAELRELMPSRPDDLQGWDLLVRHEAALRNYSAAAKAQSNVVRLSNGGDVDDLVRLVDLMVAATNGQVSPEAEDIAREILRRDEENVPARYYIGAMHFLTARPDIAFRLWRPIVEAGDETYHTALARAQIEEAAWRAGVEYTLPEVRGPSAAEMAAAEDMDPDDRAAMIGGMVAGLANRLAVEGGPASDWARLIRAYGVLGETDTAAEIWAEARTAFASDPQALSLLEDAAIGAGVAE